MADKPMTDEERAFWDAAAGAALGGLLTDPDVSDYADCAAINADDLLAERRKRFGGEQGGMADKPMTKGAREYLIWRAGLHQRRARNASSEATRCGANAQMARYFQKNAANESALAQAIVFALDRL